MRVMIMSVKNLSRKKMSVLKQIAELGPLRKGTITLMIMSTPQMASSIMLILAFILTGVFYLATARYFEFPNEHLRFTTEDIKLIVSPERLYVEGIYKCESDTPLYNYSIYYPFYLGRDSKFPDKFSVAPVERGKLRNLNFYRKNNLMMFYVPVEKGNPVNVRVIYEQEGTNNRAIYLTETTRKWKRAVKNAVLVVRLEGGIKSAIVITPSNEKLAIFGQRTFHLDNFYPPGNLVVEQKDES